MLLTGEVVFQGGKTGGASQRRNAAGVSVGRAARGRGMGSASVRRRAQRNTQPSRNARNT